MTMSEGTAKNCTLRGQGTGVRYTAVQLDPEATHQWPRRCSALLAARKRVYEGRRGAQSRSGSRATRGWPDPEHVRLNPPPKAANWGSSSPFHSTQPRCV